MAEKLLYQVKPKDSDLLRCIWTRADVQNNESGTMFTTRVAQPEPQTYGILVPSNSPLLQLLLGVRCGQHNRQCPGLKQHIDSVLAVGFERMGS